MRERLEIATLTTGIASLALIAWATLLMWKGWHEFDEVDDASLADRMLVLTALTGPWIIAAAIAAGCFLFSWLVLQWCIAALADSPHSAQKVSVGPAQEVPGETRQTDQGFIAPPCLRGAHGDCVAWRCVCDCHVRGGQRTPR